MFESDAEKMNREEDETSPESATPKIEGADQKEGQTQHPAPEDDVGVPPQEEIAEREEEAHEEKD